MEQEFYYKVTKAGFEYFSGLMSELKKLNPDVDIKGVEIDRKNGGKSFEIITLQPIDGLKQPQGYFGNALGRTIIPETLEEYNLNFKGDFLHFNVSEKLFNEFSEQLSKLNPEASISYNYDKEQKVGTITSSIAFDEINFPEGYYGGLGINEVGNVGYLNDRIINYSVVMDENNEYKCVPKEQKYYVQKMQNEVSLNTIEEPVEVEQPKEEEKEKDYLRLIAAQNESERTLKIVQIENTINDEKKQKVKSAVLSGIFITGMVAAVHFSGVDVENAIRLELEAINSMDALKEYFSTITPAMWATAAGTVINVVNYIRHRRREKNATIEYENMQKYAPVNLQDEVERHARNK